MLDSSMRSCTAAPATVVYKVGASTGLTRAHVLCTTRFRKCSEDEYVPHLIVKWDKPEENDFARNGDSGSIYYCVSDDGQHVPVAVHIGSGTVGGEKVSVGVPIDLDRWKYGDDADLCFDVRHLIPEAQSDFPPWVRQVYYPVDDGELPDWQDMGCVETIGTIFQALTPGQQSSLPPDPQQSNLPPDPQATPVKA